MVGDIITDFLKENRRIVIPDLGAFLKKDDSSVVFVPFLNKNDGVLSEIVGKFYSVSSAEADSIISQYVLSINNSISDNGYFFIKNLGSLKKDRNGILYLDTKEPDKAPIQKSDRTEDIKEAIIFPQVEAVKETPKIIEPGKAEIPLTLNDVIKTQQKPAASPTPVVSSSATTPIEEKRFPKPKRDIPQQPVKKSRKPDFILIVSIIIAIIAIIVMIYSYYITKPVVFPLN